MKKALVVTLCAIAACMWVEPAQACGMFIRPMHYDRDPDMSKILLVRARTFERNGETRSALRLYERILNDEYAGKMRRATAALASYRIHKTSNDAARANARLDLAVRLNPRNRNVQLAIGAELVDYAPGEAVAALRRALLLGLQGRRKADAHAWMARAYAKQGKRMSAAEHLVLAEQLGASTNLLANARWALNGAGDTVVAQRTQK